MIAKHGPLGLARADRSTGERRQLIVHPRTYPLSRLPPGRARSLDGTADDTANGSITFHALREYVIGDELRHVHWRTTARTGTLMVREHMDTSQTDTTIVFDTGDRLYDEDAFEEAVDIAASLVAAATARRFPIQLLTTSGVRVGTKRGARDAVRFLDTLARLSPGSSGKLAETVAGLVRSGRGDAVVVITGALSEDDRSTVSRLRRHYGTVTVVSVRVDAWSSPTTTLPGVRVLDVLTAGEMAALWNRSVAR